MHRGVVQRVGRIGNTQKARRLLKCLSAKPLYPLKLLSSLKCAILSSVLHNALCQGRAYSRYIREQMPACRIKVYTHTIYATLHNLVQLLLKKRLVHIVLILPYAQRFGVYLHKFCQRVHKTSAYGDGAPYCNIILRELLPCGFGGGVDGGSILAYREDLNLLRKVYALYKGLRLSSCSAVSYGHHLYLIGLQHIGEPLHRDYLLILRRVRIDCLVMQ